MYTMLGRLILTLSLDLTGWEGGSALPVGR